MASEAVPSAVPTSESSTVAAEARQPWGQLTLLGGLLCVDSSESSVITTLFPAIRHGLGLPLSALGALNAVGRLVSVVTGPLWVLIAQRYSRKKALVLCCGFWGVWTVAAGFAQNFVELLVLCTIVTVGLTGGGPLSNGLIADMFDDERRGRAAGMLYGIAALGTGVIAPSLGALSKVHDGWRYGFFVSGAIQILFGLLVLVFLKDPGVGAAERRPVAAPVTALKWEQVKALTRIGTLRVMCLQRLTTGQFVLLGYGVTFLVDDRHFSNAKAGLISGPAAICFLFGTLGGGLLADRVHRRWPRSGRVMTLQASIFAFALFAFIATQFPWKSLGVYLLLFGAVAAAQSMNPGLNRPIVMATVVPELRAAAFALMLSAEALGWGITALLAGIIGQAYSLQTAFLWLAVILMVANGALLTFMYRPYVRDSQAVQAELDRRSAAGGTTLEAHA